jgi:hypothetical protein
VPAGALMSIALTQIDLLPTSPEPLAYRFPYERRLVKYAQKYPPAEMGLTVG